MHKCVVNNKTYDFTEIFDFINSDSNSKVIAIKKTMELTGLDLESSKMLVNKILTNRSVPAVFNGRIKTLQLNNSNTEKTQNQPKCPTCSSTNIQKISATSKAAGAMTFGLFSKTAKSQFKCNNCGYKW